MDDNQLSPDEVLVSFDGWSNNYNYWAKIDAPDIHPIGYCDNNQIKLQPPKDLENFSWITYLQNNSFTPAPFDLFTALQTGNTSRQKHMNLLPSKSGEFDKRWEIGMKLEAKDRQYPSLICVATISDIRYEGNDLICFNISSVL